MVETEFKTMKTPDPLSNKPARRTDTDINMMTSAACLDRICRTVSSEGLCIEVVRRLRKDFQFALDRFGVDIEGASLLAFILEKTPTHHPADDEDLARFLGCSNIEFLSFSEKLAQMCRNGLIRQGCSHGTVAYAASAELIQAVEKDLPFTPVSFTGLTQDEFFARMHDLLELWRTDCLNSTTLANELDNLVRQNDQLSFCRETLASPLFPDCSATDRAVFFLLSDSVLSGTAPSEEIGLLGCLAQSQEETMQLRRQLLKGQNALQRLGLADFAIVDGFKSTDRIELTDKARKLFFAEMDLPAKQTVTHKDIIKSSSIPEKALFFNHSERESLARLEALLQNGNFRAVQQRLYLAGMRTGFNALFYGAPGTGKTECVKQLARRSGRDVFPVNMAQLKSKWVGESEKTVKSLFDLYRRICRTNPVAPILLFNEADAIFSKRIEQIEHNADQMNNTIQDIILQEMESIDGILIATTNLPGALDEAFERRFIYKVEFSLPDSSTREKIWRSLIPTLSEGDAAALAEKYPFSGGNIENIARKNLVEYVLSGETPSVETLEVFCSEERLKGKNSQKRIGF